jgi:DHA1 family inner membrane transport protein
MPTSIFNLGTAIGTAISGVALGSTLRALGPPLVGTVGAALIFVPLVALIVVERRVERRAGREITPGACGQARRRDA